MKDKSVKELIKIAKIPLDKPKSEELFITPIRRFLLDNNIISGDYPIPTLLIYDKYIQWCKITNEIPLKIPVFSSQIKQFFHYINHGGYRLFKLNPNGFNLSVEHIENIRQLYKVNKKHEKKDKNK